MFRRTLKLFKRQKPKKVGRIFKFNGKTHVDLDLRRYGIDENIEEFVEKLLKLN